jgi:hypothetical protein
MLVEPHDVDVDLAAVGVRVDKAAVLRHLTRTCRTPTRSPRPTHNGTRTRAHAVEHETDRGLPAQRGRPRRGGSESLVREEHRHPSPPSATAAPLGPPCRDRAQLPPRTASRGGYRPVSATLERR